MGPFYIATPVRDSVELTVVSWRCSAGFSAIAGGAAGKPSHVSGTDDSGRGCPRHVPGSKSRAVPLRNAYDGARRARIHRRAYHSPSSRSRSRSSAAAMAPPITAPLLDVPVPRGLPAPVVGSAGDAGSAALPPSEPLGEDEEGAPPSVWVGFEDSSEPSAPELSAGSPVLA